MLKFRPRHYTVLTICLIFALTLGVASASKCVKNCLTCERGVCSKCAIGYGLEENECKECDRENCVDCTGDTQDCRECAAYHHRLSVEGGKYHECEKCGFGCEKCANKEKCLLCAPMFSPNIIERNSCIVNHVKLFLILICVMTGICFMSCLAFWCSPGPGMEEYIINMGRQAHPGPGTVLKTENAPLKDEPQDDKVSKKQAEKDEEIAKKKKEEEEKAEAAKKKAEESESSGSEESGSSSYESSEESNKKPTVPPKK